MSEQSTFDIDACLARVRQLDQAAARQLVDELYPLVIRIEPPLVIEEALLDRALGIFEQSVRGTVEMLAGMQI